MVAPEMTTAGGYLLPLALVFPLLGMLVGFVLGGVWARRLVMVLLPLGLLLSVAILVELVSSGQSLVYHLGAWAPPLGIALRADGLSGAMLLATALVLAFIALFARTDFPDVAPGGGESRAALMFWVLVPAIWVSLNTVFLAGDLFTLYVALELLTFAAVPLVCLDSSAATLRAALRYLLFALLGSVVYLLGAVLLYGSYGTLDIALLKPLVGPGPVTWLAAALMTVGLLAKTALFPLHLWLPPAHAGAPAPASAMLSALVVKGSFFLVIRLWLDVMPGVVTPAAGQLLGALGVVAILAGNAVALRQSRLKLLIAYSTVAQIGYLFLMFPLMIALTDMGLPTDKAVTGGLLQMVSHATAKAAMFMAAGLGYSVLGHDRIADLHGLAQRLPKTVLAFALGGAALVGLPPSGGFMAKWLLLSAALISGQWWWMAAMVVGGLLTAAYVFSIVVKAMTPPPIPAPTASATAIVSTGSRENIVLALAVLSFMLGCVALLPFDVAQIGRQIGGSL